VAALAEVEKACQLDPNCWEAAALAGALLLESGDFDRAIGRLSQSCTRATESDREAIAALSTQAQHERSYRQHLDAGHKAISAKQFPQAAAEFSSAWLLLPERGEAGVAAATALALAGDSSRCELFLDLLSRSPHARIQRMAGVAREDLRPLLEAR
jgi:thioredoxin-like negative regulator of GroEL